MKRPAIAALVILPLAVSEPRAAPPGPSTTRCEGIETMVSTEMRCLKPKDLFRDCPDCPEMVVVPAGEFMMGSPESELDRKPNEGPQHKVTIAKPFAVGKFEVTFAEWDACVAGGGCTYKPGDAGWGRGKRPVINVSWDDAKAYVAWLAKTTGKTYRLLSEAEWEYAARAGTTTPFSTGETITTDQANFAERGRDTKTVDVGSFEPNTFGLYDMHGNVWEWVDDCYADSYKGAPTEGSAVSSGKCEYRVARGGSVTSLYPVRSAFRFGIASGERFPEFGFRVGRTLLP